MSIKLIFKITFLIFCTINGIGSAQSLKTKQNQALQDVKSFRKNVPLPAWAMKIESIPVSTNKEPLITRLHETQLWLGTNPGTLYSRAVQANEKNSLAQIGQLSVDYFPAYQQLQLHRITIIRNGETIEKTKDADIKLLQRESSIELGMMGGATTVQILLNDVRVGDTVWMIYSILGDNPVLNGKTSRMFSWDENAYVEYRKLTITHPLSRKINWRQLGDFNTVGIQAKKELSGDNQIITFEGKALEAVEFESNTPNSFLPVRLIQVSEFADWNDVAGWANGLFPKNPPNKEIVKLARSFATNEGDIAKATAALRWVQEQIRYFSLSIGESSHRPAKPEVVVSRRYGDCKDKSYLLITLLNELGIKATPVLLAAESQNLPAKSLPLPTVFDHVIVQIRVGDRDYLVDPTRTNQIAPIDRLPQLYQGASALILSGDISGLTTLPFAENIPVHFERREYFTVKNMEGDAEIDLKQVYRGEYADFARGSFERLTKSELKKFVLGIFESRFPEIELIDAPSFTNNVTDNSLELRARTKAKTILTHANEKYSLEYDASEVTNRLRSPDKVIRNYPYLISPDQFHGRYYLDVSFPENVREFKTSSAEKLDNPFFVISEEFAALGNRYSLVYDFKSKVDQVAPKDMPVFQKNTKELNRFVHGQLLVSDSRISEKAEALFNFRNFTTIKLGGDKLALLQTLKGMEKDDPEACNIVMDAINLTHESDRLMEKVLAELEVALQPEKNNKNKAIAQCNAKLLFNSAKYQASLNVLKNIDGGAHDLPNLLQMAWSATYLDQKEEALGYLDQIFSLNLKSDSGPISGSQLVQVLTIFKRLKSTIPEKWKKLANNSFDSPWPRPLLELQLGNRTKQSLQEYIEQYSVDTQVAYNTELQFYLGNLAIAEGNEVEARSAFFWFVRNSPVFSPLMFQAYAEYRKLEFKSPLYFEGLNARFTGKSQLAIEKWKQLIAQSNPAGYLEMGKAYYFGSDGLNKDYQEAFKYFSIAAEKGLHDAENFIALMYDDGEGVSRDTAKAISLFEKAAAKNDKHALFNLAHHYQSGNGVIKNLETSLEYYRRAAELGNSDAQYIVAKFYMQGKGTPVNNELAYKWASLASINGKRDAQILLARLLAEGDAVKRDGRRALFLLGEIEKKNAEVWTLIAWILEEGVDVTVDNEKALKAYTYAYELGGIDAGAHIGKMHLDGRGVIKNESKGMTYIRDAARQGSQFANTMLNQIEAEKGDLQAQLNLALAYHFGHGVPVDYTIAFKWYQVAADRGNLLSINNLGDLYEKGFGTEMNLSKALSLYEKVAEKGYYMGFVSIASLLENGLGLQKNVALAYLYYSIAEKLSNSSSGKYTSRIAKQLNETEKKELQLEANKWVVGKPLPAYSGK